MLESYMEHNCRMTLDPECVGGHPQQWSVAKSELDRRT
jgi:hypothetical protein